MFGRLIAAAILSFGLAWHAAGAETTPIVNTSSGALTNISPGEAFESVTLNPSEWWW
jgi:hypothetical protein